MTVPQIENYRKYDYFLPTNLRKELKDPIGELLKPNTKRYDDVLSTPPEHIICVGDIVSKTFLERTIFPDVIITDGITKRKEIPLIVTKMYTFVKVKNPAATITSQAWLAIRNALNTNHKTHVFVEGEEDLLTIPVILEAKEEQVVFYGQPNEGMVMVIPTLQLKKELIRLLDRFEKRLSHKKEDAQETFP